jgi:hypothetical protein
MNPVKSFRGAINGKVLYNDFIKKLDYNLMQADRMKLVENLLYPDGKLDDYFQTYFDEKYNAIPKSTDHLSSDNTVCKGLETLANYILYAKDAEVGKKVKYNFYNKESFNKLLNKDIYINDITYETIHDGESIETEVIDFLMTINKNYKKEKKQKLLAEDYIDDAFLSEIKIYQIDKETGKETYKESQFVHLIVENQKHIASLGKRFLDKKYNKFKVREILSCLKNSQLQMKVIIKRPIIFKDPLKDSTVLDYDKFDFTNVNHVRALLLYHNNNTQTDVGCLVFDLNNLIDKLELSEKESIALTKYRDGWTLPMIAQLLYFKKPYSVEALLKQVSKKVVKKYLEMCEDRHYLYVEKGVYKKCTKCGEIKLALNTHFTFQATNILFPPISFAPP